VIYFRGPMSTETSSAAAPAASTSTPSHATDSLGVLMLGALGVVYGDIGTSPLYAFREGLKAAGGVASVDNVLGILSLMAWSLTLVVSVKYVMIVSRADNKGEGGIMALTALARSAFQSRGAWLLAVGVAGSALFFGDSIITPAVSVLSAIEGLETVAPGLDRFVLPLTVVILVVLFAAQRYGTAKVSSVFGPIIIVWFIVLAIGGAAQIAHHPEVLLALSPTYAISFLVTHWALAGVVIGAVFLAVTGAEALYADMGHFGRRPIALSWFVLVFPALLINYFGQGAFVLGGSPNAGSDPFFLMFPEWARIPMIGLATAATVIASQAVISGTYSLAQQAMALGLLPRLTLHHTSETQSGQIYMPQINGLLLIGVLVLVLGFKSSSALSSAYGIAVSGVMMLTAILTGVVMVKRWHWSPVAAACSIGTLLLIDIGFFVSNAGKFTDGGWVPATVALAVAAVMAIWINGRTRLAAKTRRDELPLQDLVDRLATRRPAIVPGTAIFLTADSTGAPAALLHSLKHYKVLHEHNVILSVETASTPFVPDDEKVNVSSLNALFSRVKVTFGFAETPNIPKALALGRKLGWTFDIMSTSFFLSRRSLKPSNRSLWRRVIDLVFIRLARNASDATEYFRIPTGRVVEIGTQVVL